MNYYLNTNTGTIKTLVEWEAGRANADVTCTGYLMHSESGDVDTVEGWRAEMHTWSNDPVECEQQFKSLLVAYVDSDSFACSTDLVSVDKDEKGRWVPTFKKPNSKPAYWDEQNIRWEYI